MNRARRTMALAVATLSTAAVLTACGGSGGASADASRGGSAPAVGTQDLDPHPAADLRQGGTLKMTIQQWIGQYNPNQVDGTQGDASAITELVEPDLFLLDAKGVPHRNPDFLTSAEVVSDHPQVVRYRLNPKAKWSDGKPLSWRDFAAQWKALNGRDKRFAAADTSGYAQISEVARGADDQEVTVTFGTPYADWQRLFDPLLPASLNATPESFATAWAGTVPVTANAFRIGSYDRTAQTITAVPDPNWWGRKPKLDRIIYWALDGSGYVDAYLNKEIDYTSAASPEAYQRLKGDKGTDIRIGARWDQVTLSLNGRRGPLKDVRVRQAVMLGVDRSALAKVAGKDLPFQPKVLGNHFFMPNQEGYQDNSGGFGKRDTARAEQMLGEIGVAVELRKVPSNDYFDKYIHRSNYDLSQFRQVDQVFRSEAYGGYRTPQGDHTFTNYGGVSSPEVDALLREASRTTDAARQIALYNKADAAVWRLGHSLPLYQRPQIFAVRKGLANFGPTGLGSEQLADAGWLK
ncbi:ABC transporter family substrate-binding protein [Streptomyces sp. 769]|uniref:ABC transporter family substrate-binding protein n=1 Tax=Streptomyces sp. 769 TaxID=1262452 RepID=UPI00057F3158|nr:ABC transporter family substrate-binding protein [Streptomyces sp. 769]